MMYWRQTGEKPFGMLFNQNTGEHNYHIYLIIIELTIEIPKPSEDKILLLFDLPTHVNSTLWNRNVTVTKYVPLAAPQFQFH